MRFVIVIAIVMAACRDSKPSDSLKASCETYAATIEASRKLRNEASMQFVSADHAMTKWKQWEQKSVDAEQDSGGEYSAAANRARGYRDAGYALCQSASMVHTMLRSVPTSDAGLLDEVAKVRPLRCQAIPLNWANFERFNSDWLAAKQTAYDVENAILDECHRRLPNWTPADARLAPITLPAE